jgi:hypothetical protein
LTKFFSYTIVTHHEAFCAIYGARVVDFAFFWVQLNVRP